MSAPLLQPVHDDGPPRHMQASDAKGQQGKSAPHERCDQYDDWAWLYDQTVGPDYCEPQLRFLQRALLPHMPRHADLLDLCCGSGQLMAPLLAAGHRVTGLDGSPGMLGRAGINAPGATLLCADARHFDLSERFDGVFSTSASLNHMADIDTLGQVFERVHNALRPGGLFVFDLNHPAQLERWWRGRPLEGGIGDAFAWMITPGYDATTKRGAFTVAMQRAPRSRDGLPVPTGPLRRRLYQLLSKPRFIGLRLALLQRGLKWLQPSWQHHASDYPITGHDLREVTHVLRAAGFTNIVLGTLDDDTPPDDRHAAHFVCRKETQA